MTKTVCRQKRGHGWGSSDAIRYPESSRPYTSNEMRINNYNVELNNAPNSKYTYTQYSADPEHKSDIRYTCPLKQLRCLYGTARGRCRRTTTVTLPMCWQHTKMVYHIRPGRTTLTGANGERLNFIGLFACDEKKSPDDIVFCKNDFIVPYVAEIVSEDVQNQRVPGNELVVYGLQQQRSSTRYDAGCIRGVGAFANTAANRSANNAGIAETNGFSSLKAKKNIRNGQEIFLDYGDHSRDYVRLPSYVSQTKNSQNRNVQLDYKCRM